MAISYQFKYSMKIIGWNIQNVANIVQIFHKTNIEILGKKTMQILWAIRIFIMIDFLMKIAPTAFFFHLINHFYRSFGFHPIQNGLKYNIRKRRLSWIEKNMNAIHTPKKRSDDSCKSGCMTECTLNMDRKHAKC